MIRLYHKKPLRVIAVLCVLFYGQAIASEHIESSISSDIVPGPVEFAVLLPDGATLGPRIREALSFLHRHLNPSRPDPVAQAGRRRFQPLKDRLGVKGHFDD